MFRRRRRDPHGSGLIIALGILAMVAIMATTFVTLMRVNSRLTRVYSDDLITEMLASGVENYTLSVLRDDQDRTLYKYENRDASVGGRPYWQGMDSYGPSDPKAYTDFRMSLPGRNTDYWAPLEHRYGTSTSNDVWYTSALDGYWQSGLYEASPGHYEWGQPSFGGPTGNGYDFCVVDRSDCAIVNPADQSGPERYYAFVPGYYNGLDDDGDGLTDPYYRWGRCEDPDCPSCNAGNFHWYFPRATSREWVFLETTLYDSTYFLTQGLPSYLHPGWKLGGSTRLPGGLFWRWAAKMGVPEERYINLNSCGNNEMIVSDSASRLNNMDGLGLHAKSGDISVAANHLGLIGWKGYPGDYNYEAGGFNGWYNAVQYSPYQLDPYRLLGVDFCLYWGYNNYPDIIQTYGDKVLDSTVAQTVAPEWVRQRWGSDGIPADGADYWRVGWRRDGATYYKIPSPDNPMGNDYYFGPAEALNHQNEDIVPGNSRVFGPLLTVAGGNMNNARNYFSRSRAYLSTYGCDTILRGKIWPTEGPLPWRPSGTQQGDWRHMDILRRINLNMIGASGPEGLPGEDTVLDGGKTLADLKQRWQDKAPRERNRLYFMLNAFLHFTNTPSPEHEACQLIASLADMVDRDQNETYYAAPDPSGAWALGVEKHPVINEVVFYSRSAANTANYELFRIRVELYNPMENIPWIKDTDEAYDISGYVLRIASHDYRLSDMVRYTTEPNTVHPDGMVIGASGVYGEPQAVGVTSHPTWNRYAHVGWAVNWPPGLTRAELEGTGFSGVKVSLWKPLTGDAALNVLLAIGKVEMINGVKHVCVDATPTIKLVRPYDTTKGENGPGQIVNDTDYDPDHLNPDTALNRNETVYLGIYRRCDPMNALIYDYSKTYTTPPHVETNPGKDDRGSVLWCPGWNIGNYPTLGRPNTDYPTLAYRYAPPRSTGTAYQYERRFEVNYKIPDSDLPSVGWLGELFLYNCAQDGPLSWVPTAGQKPGASNYPRYGNYNNTIESVKLDLFRPWNKVHNLSLYDMFTVRDPSNDGIDNDGDGAIDEADRGLQAGDLLGPEVRIYGLVDVNHVGVRVLGTTMVDYRIPPLRTILSSYYGPQRERYHANHIANDGGCMGPWDSIGDMLQWDEWTKEDGTIARMTNPASTLGHYTNWKLKDAPLYTSSVNLCGKTDQDQYAGGFCPGRDDDGDGIVDERDERDFWFTQAANFLTTRSNTFTIEIITQLTDPPYYPGANYHRGAYKCKYNYGYEYQPYAQRHLLLLVDRSTTLRLGPNGSCDFTGPVRVLARRWSHERK